MIKFKQKTILLIGLGVLAVVIGAFLWQHLQAPALPEGIVSGNGRLEATEVDITTKFAGRLASVSVKEGDDVEAGQVLARMDIREVEAELRQAQAQVTQTQKQRIVAAAVITQRNSEVTLAEKNLTRSRELYENKNIPIEQLQRSETTLQTAKAVRAAAEAGMALSEATIEAARARVESVRTRIDDSELKSPISGRVLYRLVEPGEVLPAGGKIFTVLNLSEISMTIFLPTKQAGRLLIGDEARIILDAIPENVIPAKVTFVSPEAQFTPKEVETRTEREKLMFRIKVSIESSALAKNVALMKTGMPGIAYLRLSNEIEWPEPLRR